MIKNVISYENSTILTIYHVGLDDKLENRKIEIRDQIGEGEIIFKEEVIEDIQLESLTNNGCKIEGVIAPLDDRNPYSNRLTAHINHFITYEKPSVIFDCKENLYELRLSDEHIEQVVAFIKKYTGLNLEKNILYLGDTFVFKSYRIMHEMVGELGLRIRWDFSMDTIIIHFKQDDVVVCTRITKNISGNIQEIVIESHSVWDSFDILIYSDKELRYMKSDVSFMRYLQLNNKLVTTQKIDKLKVLGDEIEINREYSLTPTFIGKRPDSRQLLLKKSNQNIIKKLELNQQSNKYNFFVPDEFSRAFKYIKEIISSTADELWIFDPYFFDNNKLNYSLDWINVAAICKARTAHIIYYDSNENDASIANISKKISDLRLYLSDVNFHFYCSNKYIHDRYIFSVNEKEVKGIAIGTSINSLESNYFGITELSRADASLVLNKLKNVLENEGFTERIKVKSKVNESNG